VFFRDEAVLDELRVILSSEVSIPHDVTLGRASHDVVTPLALTRPATVRVVHPYGTGINRMPEYQVEWAGDHRDGRLLSFLINHWPATSVAHLQEAATSNVSVSVYPEMPILVYGRLQSSHEDDRPKMSLQAERGRRAVELSGVAEIGRDWPKALRRQRVFAVAIIATLRPIAVRVAALAF
jgi:hypothetical protein